MAETSGVTNTEHRSTPSGGGSSGGSWFKKNKKVVLIGGAGAAILLMGHKGNKSSGGSQSDPNAQLQAAADAAAQAQTDAALAQGAAGPLAPGGVAPTTIDTGGGSYTAPATTINASDTDTGTTPNAAPDASNDNSLTKAVAADAAADGANTKAVSADTKADKAHKTNQAPKHGKGKPVKGDGKVHHPSEGAKVQGHTGTTVHGRTFPGATGHNVGAARRINGNTHQDVTVHYGGHTETHTSVNGGHQWIDNTKGKNPPSRGPQHTVMPTSKPPAHEPAPRRPAVPARRPAPVPARRAR